MYLGTIPYLGTIRSVAACTRRRAGVRTRARARAHAHATIGPKDFDFFFFLFKLGELVFLVCPIFPVCLAVLLFCLAFLLFCLASLVTLQLCEQG